MFVWDIDPVLLRMGPVQIRYYGIMFLATIMCGWWCWRWQMLRGGYDEEKAERFLIIGVIAVIGGSRLGHVLFYEFDRFMANPIEILKVWKGGLASHGATIGLMIALAWYAKREKMRVLEVTDRFAMSAAIGATFVRIGNFFNSEIVGRATDVPWAVKFPRSYYDYRLPVESVPWRHPSQLYEALMGTIVFATLYLIDRRYKESRPLGLLSGLFLVQYFTFRFCVEFVKEFQTLVPGRSFFTMGQYLSIPFVFIGIGMIVLALRNGQPTNQLAPVSRKKAKRRG